MKKQDFQIKYYLYKARHEKDPESFGKLYDLYIDKIYRFIRFKVKTDEEAQDITSDVFLKTWQYVQESSRKIENFNALIYRVARNCIIDYYRKKSKENIVTVTEQFEEIIADRSSNLVDDIDLQIDFEQIEGKLKLLKEEYREVIILKYIDELSTTEISEILEKSKSNVRVLLHRALKTLKEIMSK